MINSSGQKWEIISQPNPLTKLFYACLSKGACSLFTFSRLYPPSPLLPDTAHPGFRSCRAPTLSESGSTSPPEPLDQQSLRSQNSRCPLSPARPPSRSVVAPASHPFPTACAPSAWPQDPLSTLWDGSMWSKIKVAKRSDGRKTESFSPKTHRGRRLLALRHKIIAAGIPLLSPEEIEEEILERRGEDEWAWKERENFTQEQIHLMVAVFVTRFIHPWFQRFQRL